MKSEIQKAREEIAKIRERVGQPTAIRVSLTPVSPEGIEGRTVTAYGEPCDPGNIDFKIPEKILPVLVSWKRHNLLIGGRSAGKSHALARFFIALAVEENARFLCLREVQSSLKESVYFLIRSIIETDPILTSFFDIGAYEIAGKNGSQFHFTGCQNFNASNIKSYEAYRYCWLEEAQSFTPRSLELIIPTIRTEGSRLFYNLNPTDETDAVYKELALAPSTDSDISRCLVVFSDNYFCPEVIKKEAAKMQERDRLKYDHVYGGLLRSIAEARIFHNWKVRPIDIESIMSQAKSMIHVGFQGTMREREERRGRKLHRLANSFYFGLDFGFTDPATLVKVFLLEAENKVLILKEFKKAKVEIDTLPDIIRNFDERLANKWPIYCDNARPDLISNLTGRGINAKKCIKKQLTDRIDQLQAWDIIIDPNCPETISEFSLYSWNEDRNGTLLPTPRDVNNHIIDAVFYALGDAITKMKSGTGYQKVRSPW